MRALDMRYSVWSPSHGSGSDAAVRDVALNSICSAFDSDFMKSAGSYVSM